MNHLFRIYKSADLRQLCHLLNRPHGCLVRNRKFYQNVFSIHRYVSKRIVGNIKFLPLSLSLLLKPKASDCIRTLNRPPTWVKVTTSHDADSWIWNLFQFVHLTLRLLVIWCIAVQLLLLYPCCRLHGQLKELWWKIVLRAIEFSGPVFVKFGQWASTRRDIFSAEMCEHLALLQHRRSPHSWSNTVSVLDREFGESWRNDFLFDGPQTPIGSGCVAQVYKMSLKPDKVGVQIPNTGMLMPLCKNMIGSNHSDPVPVAVKVLHPKIHQHFKRDTIILNSMAAFVQFVCPWLKWISLVECVGEFCQFMLSQIDLEREAFYLERFSENFREDSCIRFPQPVYPYVTKHVLVESWEEGELIGKFLDTKNSALREKLSDVLVDCLLKMTFSDNLVHGDLHPGNILVQNSISEEWISKATVDDIGDIAVLNFVTQHETKTLLRVVLLDCGLSTALSPKDYANFSSVFKAIVMGEGEEVGRLFLKHCINECRNPDEFVRNMADLVEAFIQNTLSLDVVDVGKLFGSLFDILTKHKVKLESNFSSMMMAIIIVEGLGRSLDPQKDLMQDAKRYLLNF